MISVFACWRVTATRLGYMRMHDHRTLVMSCRYHNAAQWFSVTCPQKRNRYARCTVPVFH